jgi:hypothetical protein
MSLLIDNSPSLVSKAVCCSLNRKVLQKHSIASFLGSIGKLKSGEGKNVRVDLHWVFFNSDAPRFKSFLTKKISGEILNGFEFLLWVLSAGGQNVTHATRVFSDSLGNTIDCAELWWDVALLTIDLHDEKWLLGVSYLQVVSLKEVLSNTHLLSIMSLEQHSNWSLLKINVLNKVGLLEPIGTDNSLELELINDSSLLILNVWRFHDLVNSFKTRFI